MARQPDITAFDDPALSALAPRSQAQQLVAACLTDVFACYHRDLLVVAMRDTQHRGDTEVLVHAAYAAAIDNADDLQGYGPQDLGLWLEAHIHDAAAQMPLTGSRRPRDGEDPMETFGIDPNLIPDVAETYERVDAAILALTALDPDTALVVVMAAAGHPLDAIAAVLDCTDKQALGLLQAGRAAMVDYERVRDKNCGKLRPVMVLDAADRSPKQQSQIDAHMRGCTVCEAFVARHNAVTDAFRQALPEALIVEGATGAPAGGSWHHDVPDPQSTGSVDGSGSRLGAVASLVGSRRGRIAVGAVAGLVIVGGLAGALRPGAPSGPAAPATTEAAAGPAAAPAQPTAAVTTPAYTTTTPGPASTSPDSVREPGDVAEGGPDTSHQATDTAAQVQAQAARANAARVKAAAQVQAQAARAKAARANAARVKAAAQVQAQAARAKAARAKAARVKAARARAARPAAHRATAPAPHYTAPAPRYSAPAPRYTAPSTAGGSPAAEFTP